MTDIVKRLQRGVDTNEPPDKTDYVMREAADEIVRLRAAAEVGEIEIGSLGFPVKTIRELTSDAVAATIERCAQVADGFGKKWASYEHEATEIAAAIRSLQ